MPGEEILHQTQPYAKDKIRWYLYLAIPTVGITLIGALYNWLYFTLMDFELTLTNRRFIIAGGWLTRTAVTIQLEKVQEVTTGQRLFERLMSHTVTLWVETAATAGTTRVRLLKSTDPLPSLLESARSRSHE